MATGMSRDAAMQLLGAGGAGSGGSSAAPVTSTLPSGLGSSAIDYENMKINDRNSWANIVLGSINTAASLVNLGFSSNMAIKQANNMQLQTEILGKSTAAVSMSSDVISAVNNAIQAGASITKEDTSTPQALNKWINDNAEKYPQLQQAAQYIQSNGNQNPFFQQSLSTAFKDWHEQRTTPSMLSATLDGVIANNLLTGVNIDLVRAESVQAQSNAALLLQKFENAKVEYNNLLSTGEKIDAERKLIESQAELVDAQTESQGLQNNIVRPQSEAYKLNADALSSRYQAEIALDIMKWSRMSQDDVKKAITDKIAYDANYGAALAAFNACCQTDLNEWAQNNSQMFTAANAYNYFHLGDILRSAADAMPKVYENPVGYVEQMWNDMYHPENVQTNVREVILNSFLPR